MGTSRSLSSLAVLMGIQPSPKVNSKSTSDLKSLPQRFSCSLKSFVNEAIKPVLGPKISKKKTPPESVADTSDQSSSRLKPSLPSTIFQSRGGILESFYSVSEYSVDSTLGYDSEDCLRSLAPHRNLPVEADSSFYIGHSQNLNSDLTLKPFETQGSAQLDRRSIDGSYMEVIDSKKTLQQMGEVIRDAPRWISDSQLRNGEFSPESENNSQLWERQKVVRPDAEEELPTITDGWRSSFDIPMPLFDKDYTPAMDSALSDLSRRTTPPNTNLPRPVTFEPSLSTTPTPSPLVYKIEPYRLEESTSIEELYCANCAEPLFSREARLVKGLTPAVFRPPQPPPSPFSARSFSQAFRESSLYIRGVSDKRAGPSSYFIRPQS